MRRLVILALVGTVALTGCVRASTTFLAPNVAIIDAKGPGTSTNGRVFQAALIQGAKATKSRGYRYFVVNSSMDTSRSGFVFSGTGTATSSFGFGAPIVMPATSIAIRMYREGEIDPAQEGVWDADALIPARPATSTARSTPQTEAVRSSAPSNNAPEAAKAFNSAPPMIAVPIPVMAPTASQPTARDNTEISAALFRRVYEAASAGRCNEAKQIAQNGGDLKLADQIVRICTPR